MDVLYSQVVSSLWHLFNISQKHKNVFRRGPAVFQPSRNGHQDKGSDISKWKNGRVIKRPVV